MQCTTDAEQTSAPSNALVNKSQLAGGIEKAWRVHGGWRLRWELHEIMCSGRRDEDKWRMWPTPVVGCIRAQCRRALHSPVSGGSSFGSRNAALTPAAVAGETRCAVAARTAGRGARWPALNGGREGCDTCDVFERVGGLRRCSRLHLVALAQGMPGAGQRLLVHIAHCRTATAVRRKKMGSSQPGWRCAGRPTAMRTIAAARMAMIGREERLAVSNERMPPCRACCRRSPCSIP